MALTVTHAFVSAIADDPVADAAGEVVPSDWNADHTIDLVSLLDGDGSQVLVTKNTNVDNADNGDLRVSAAAYDINAISGRWNQVYRIGYNMATNGIGYDAGEPSMGIHWESFYESGGAELLEWHQSVFKPDNSEVRFETWAIDRSTYEVQKSSKFYRWSWDDMGGTQVALITLDDATSSFQWAINGSTSNIVYNVNNVAWFKQRNAADSSYINLPYIGSDDRLVMHGALQSVGATPTTGTYANQFVSLQATSGVTNGVLLNLQGPAGGITGTYNVIDAACWSTVATVIRLYNSRNDSGSQQAKLVLLSRETYGDPLVQFEINGTTTWSFGVDNSDADSLVISRHGNIGTNNALRVDTSNNALWYANLGIANATNGQACEIKTLTELLTIAAAATSTTTIQKPANSIILAVPVRVTTAVTCTSTFTVGDAGSATRFSTAAVSKAATSTDKGTAAGAYYNATAEGIVITPDTVPSDATGRVRVTIYYIELTPPTS